MIEVFGAVSEAFNATLQIQYLTMLVLGVFFGLIIGVVPGIGGLTGLTLLLPFTYGMDAHVALALLIGMHAVISTSDSIPAILLGVPGTVGSAATVLDGYPMARKGKAGRALGAAFSASLLGGLFGALVLLLSTPVLRPLMLSVGTPEMFAVCVFGLSLAVTLTGHKILPGLALVGLGLLLATIGEDYQTGTQRFTFDTLYLWDGLPLLPLSLGLFALPEIAEVAMMKRSVSSKMVVKQSDQMAGLMDVFGNLRIVLSSSSVGAVLGAIPGIGSAVIDWVAYGYIVHQNPPNSHFGHGDVRGVIASEAANNAKEGGALIPTVAFGVPGSAAMAILLGAFTMHGIVPGPDMLGRDLDLTYGMIISLSLANVLGAVLCFVMVPVLVRVSNVSPAVLVPSVLSVVAIGALNNSGSWSDFAVLLIAGIFGYVLRILDWPRAPLIIGFVLGPLVERYLSTSIQIYGAAFLSRPVVILLLSFAVIGALKNVWQMRSTEHQQRIQRSWMEIVSAAFIVIALIFAIALAVQWPTAAKILPIGSAAFATFALFIFIFTREKLRAPGATDQHPVDLSGTDITQWQRAVVFFIWIVLAAPFGYILGAPAGISIWMGLYMWLYFSMTPLRALLAAGSMFLFISLMLEEVMRVSLPIGLL